MSDSMGQNLDNQDMKSTKPAQSGRDPKAARERRRKREAARRKREKQIRIRMIMLGLILLAVIGVGAAALMIHMRNVKEKEAAIEEARRTEAEQAAFEATRQEEPVSPETPAAAAAATTVQKTEEDAAAAAATTVQKTEEDAAAAAATTGKNAEEEGALAASRKAAQEEKERKESEKIPGLSESYDFKTTDSTADVPEDMDSEFAVLVDLEKGTVIAGRGYQDPIYPASMTKVLTLLVAVENIDQSKLDTDTYEIDTDITDYVFTNQMSQVGFDIGDTPSIRSLLYGTILPSGADAALALAKYTAGSEEAFVELMNKKLEELGISDTAHFTNVVGAHAEDHYCSLLDMATIMRAAMDNKTCREVLSCRYYEVARSSDDDAEVIGISNWFLRRIEDKDTHGTVEGGKTGYTDEAGNCAVSYQVSDDGGHYICVTANAPGGWPCIYDHVELYEMYTQ
ncbi:MAG: D-alanyl-D-alanine carboxypeptidase [Lachnospiraceae bacterium]|nr:D-alanyl-D-alanine carboxypeptidase [Lachnospiraceae bacterium]